MHNAHHSLSIVQGTEICLKEASNESIKINVCIVLFLFGIM
jgi:hypothetical protein